MFNNIISYAKSMVSKDIAPGVISGGIFGRELLIKTLSLDTCETDSNAVVGLKTAANLVIRASSIAFSPYNPLSLPFFFATNPLLAIGKGYQACNLYISGHNYNDEVLINEAKNKTLEVVKHVAFVIIDYYWMFGLGDTAKFIDAAAVGYTVAGVALDLMKSSKNIQEKLLDRDVDADEMSEEDDSYDYDTADEISEEEKEFISQNLKELKNRGEFFKKRSRSSNEEDVESSSESQEYSGSVYEPESEDEEDSEDIGFVGMGNYSSEEEIEDEPAGRRSDFEPLTLEELSSERSASSSPVGVRETNFLEENDNDPRQKDDCNGDRQITDGMKLRDIPSPQNLTRKNLRDRSSIKPRPRYCSPSQVKPKGFNNLFR